MGQHKNNPNAIAKAAGNLPAKPKEIVTKYKIGEDDLVKIGGRELVYVKEYDGGIVLRAANDDKAPAKTYDWKHIATLVKARVMQVEKNHFSERNAIIRARSIKAFELDPATVLRAKMVSEFIAQEECIDEAEQQFHRSKDDIKAFTAKFSVENHALVEEARAYIAGRGKGKLFVGPRQFCRLLERFEQAELDHSAMGDRRAGRVLSRSTFTREELEFQLVYADLYRTPDGHSIVHCYDEMIEENDKRESQGLLKFRVPSLPTFRRLIREGNDFLNETGRTTNKHRIERRYAFAQKGLAVTRPLQIVEMDCHEVDLMLMLTKNGIWDHLHPEAQARVEEMGRVWLSVALDAYSRSVVGMKVVKGSPSAEATVATLAMVAQSKDAVAAHVGARSGWSQCGTPEGIHTDAGAEYVASHFELAAMMFTGRHRIPPSKHPHLRARIERFFGTINRRYIHLFSGQTFSSPLKRDEYDSAKYAHLLDEEFADLIVRIIVDCYHNTKHRSTGMTPLQMWERGSQLANGAVLPPPTDDEYRSIFGITLHRKIGNHGIEIWGSYYSSPELLEIRKKWYAAELVVRVNEQDLGTISVKHRRLNKWIDVPATFDGLNGVTLEEWTEVPRYVAQRFGAKAEYSEGEVRTGLRAVKEFIARSKARPGIALHMPLAERLALINEKIGATFAYSQRETYDYGRYVGEVGCADDLKDWEDDAAEQEAEKIVAQAASEAAAKAREVERTDFAPTLPEHDDDVVFDRSGFMTTEERRSQRKPSSEGEPSPAERVVEKPARAVKKTASPRTDAPQPAASHKGPDTAKPKKTIGFGKKK
ncbi:Mu transposase C-terminal domain-containing protein [Neorhizobium sp. BT27B]|uniref:Mu transposase C-terminal domain-containing protein n=1 Tax=Neorhizobium sp. BT27B TaxID=3142625 RepID=UPI003D2DFBE9